MFREKLPEIAMMYGLPIEKWPVCPEPSIAIKGGEKLEVGKNIAKVIHTPGHSPGHVSFYFETEALVVSGDVLFQGSIGRTDLPGGDHNQLIATIRSEFLNLPDATKVLSGHGDDTTIGAERRDNPFLL
jgi:glyoxylase-like metal-dependent hydrolase (beta-lactamase superfamily II)